MGISADESERALGFRQVMAMASINKYAIIDSWLSRLLRRDAYELVLSDELVARLGKTDSDENKYVTKLQSTSVFIYARVPVTSLDAVRCLEKRGFNLIETSVTLEKPIASTVEFSSRDEIRFADTADQSQVEALARNGFAYSRFHLDSAIDRDVANEIKAQWAGNYFVGNRGNAMVVAAAGRSIIGFLLLVYGESGTLIIDLVAVGEKYRRRAVAGDMVRFAECHVKEFTQVRVGTQVSNLPAVRFYEELGFRVTAAQYTFHYHHE